MSKCPNCGSEVETQFCGGCGQEQGQLLIPVRVWLSEAASDLFSADSRLPRTLATLITKPGALTAEWVKGRRHAFTPPLRLYFFTALVFFFVWPLTSPTGSIVSGIVHAVVGHDSPLEGISTSDPYQLVTSRVMELVPLLLVLVLLPSFAGLSYTLLRERRSYFAPHLVFSLHAHSVLFMLMLGYQPTRVVDWFDEWGLVLVALVFAVYVGFAAQRAFPRGWTGTAIRTLVLLIAYFVLFTISIIATSEAVEDAYLGLAAGGSAQQVNAAVAVGLVGP